MPHLIALAVLRTVQIKPLSTLHLRHLGTALLRLGGVLLGCGSVRLGLLGVLRALRGGLLGRRRVSRRLVCVLLGCRGVLRGLLLALRSHSFLSTAAPPLPLVRSFPLALPFLMLNILLVVLEPLDALALRLPFIFFLPEALFTQFAPACAHCFSVFHDFARIIVEALSHSLLAFLIWALTIFRG